MASQNWTLKSAFAYFGAKATNPRWSWSARSEDGKTVVVTLWDDNIEPDGSVDLFAHKRLPLWEKTRGNKDRIKNLSHAEDQCDGLFRVVRVSARDESAYPRSIAKRWPDPALVMKITDLDRTTGEFRAVSVER
jgi:hypothetical protein